MANRVVSVALRADVGGYLTGLQRAAGATTAFGRTTDNEIGRANAGMSAMGKVGLAAGGLLAVGLGTAISRAAEFEAAMSGVAASTGASASELERLKDAAVRAGADSQYSAREAADAINEMAKAGVSTADILSGGLNGALDLAAAGQLEVAEAAGIASVAMTQFKLSGEDLPHVADLLAAGANLALGSVSDLGQALNQAGTVASSAGVSLEETTGTLAAMASAGLLGSDAGTSLRSALMHLSAPSGTAAAEMERLGINAYDAGGNFVGMADLAGQLQSRLGDLTQAERDKALATIFGSDAVRAANVLYTQGAQGIADWTDNVNQAGFAQDNARKLTDNLTGDIERLGGAIDAAFIQTGGAFTGVLREIVQGLSGMLDVGVGLMDFLTSLPTPVIVGAAALGGMMLITGPLAGSFATLAAQVSFATGVIGASGGVMAATRTAASGLLGTLGGPLGIAVAGAAAGLTLLVQWLNSSDEATEDATRAADDYTTALKDSNGAITDAVRQAAAKAAQDSGLLDTANALGIAEGDVTRAITDQGVALDRTRSQLEDFIDAHTTSRENNYGVTTTEIDAQGQAAQEALTSLNLLAETTTTTASEQAQLAAETAGATAAMGETAVAATTYGGMLAEIGEAADESAQHLQDWLDMVRDANEGFIEPLTTYQDLLTQKKDAEQASAQATADATEDSSDSWEDYVTDVSVSLSEYATQLETQIANQQAWRSNIALIAQRGGLDVANALMEMGVEGADITAQMATALPEDFARMAAALTTEAGLAGEGATNALATEMQVMAEVGRQGAAATAQSIADQLGLGVDQVAGIASQYGVVLAGGINPVLTAIGRARLDVAGRLSGVNGGPLPAGGHANGGMIRGPGTATSDSIPARLSDGEYVIRASSVAKYGVRNLDAINQGRASQLAYYASGGFVSASDVPGVPSTSPFGPPLSTSAAGTMGYGRDAVVAWLDQQREATASALATAGDAAAGGGAIGGDWKSIWSYVKARIPQARQNSTFRPGDPGYHGRGKAIDFGFGSGPGGAGSAGLASIERLLHDDLGGSLAEIIYDGIGNSRSDIKNGRPHTYSAGTQAEHRNHVHAAVYDTGGVLGSGMAALNLSGSPERVLSPSQTVAFEAGMQSREFGGGSSAANGVTVNSGDTMVAVYIDGQEFRGIARVEADKAVTNGFRLVDRGLSGRGVR